VSRPVIDLGALEADPRVIWTQDVLRFRDTDANGHINNSTFAVFCESGRVNFLHEVLAARGLPGIFFVVARLAIDFRAELHFPGRVRCGTWVPAVGRSSIGFAQALVNDSGGLVATAEATVVQMDLVTRRPCAVGGDLRDRIAPLLRP
jgi:acyl-CoA thioester hydrolase